jgi:septum formation protein
VSFKEQRIYLASRSPRRRELLKQIGVNFDVLLLREDPSRGEDVDERPLPEEQPHDHVTRIARAKAELGWVRVMQRRLRPSLVLGADTSVILEGEVFGKPESRQDAERMLARLAGRSHQVLSAVALCYREQVQLRLSTSRVDFRPMTDQEIRRYVATGEPLDKAGAYAIQGRGAAFIRNISGSYSGVMGLPLFETVELLQYFGFEVL